jgi:uncharacterized protein (TIGR01319 family)
VSAVVCVDFGSTFTKAVLVDRTSGELLATASHPTTLPDATGAGDVLDGYDACVAELAEQDPRAVDADVLACSSAGGGLRIAVVGNEELVTAEAGRRVALSSGGKVVSVVAMASGGDLTGLDAPDVVLLTGGTDGGNGAALVDAARAVAGSGFDGPVVVAGNVDAREEVAGILAGQPHVLADNAVPRIGVLAPESARAAVRAQFLQHVIAGKGLTARGAELAQLVQGPTPDVVLAGVEVLAYGIDEERPGIGDVAVVDVGGATTDVHSVVEIDAPSTEQDAGLARQVVAPVPVSRTVEGDLGMRWSAVPTVEEGLAAGLLDAADADRLRSAAEVRRADPSLLPADRDDARDDERIATAAVGVALRRHAGRRQVAFGPDGRVVERSGKDLREVDLLVGSGGVLRNNPPELAARVLASVTGDVPGGWQLPRAPRVVVDEDYVLVAAGLLVADHPEAAYDLLRRLLRDSRVG